MQWEQRVYTWEKEAYKDMIIIMLYGINTSTDTLKDCWIGYIADTDLRVLGGDTLGVMNDKARYYIEDPDLNLASTWTLADKGETNFGYIGVSMVMSPAVDANNYVRKDQAFYSTDDQLGLRTCKFFSIDEDKNILGDFYNNLSQDSYDQKDTPDDVRMMLGAGAFNLLPKDTVKVAIMLNFAMPKNGSAADGSVADMENLVTQVKLGRKLFYDQKLSTDVQSDLNPNFNITSISPNPATDNAQLRFSLPTTANVQVKIVNVLGETVESNNIDFPAGENILNINTFGMTSGNYYVILNYGGFAKTAKLNVIR
jgi:hypothetical protein